MSIGEAVYEAGGSHSTAKEKAARLGFDSAPNCQWEGGPPGPQEREVVKLAGRPLITSGVGMPGEPTDMTARLQPRGPQKARAVSVILKRTLSHLDCESTPELSHKGNHPWAGLPSTARLLSNSSRNCCSLSTGISNSLA